MWLNVAKNNLVKHVRHKTDLTWPNLTQTILEAAWKRQTTFTRVILRFIKRIYTYKKWKLCSLFSFLLCRKQSTSMHNLYTPTTGYEYITWPSSRLLLNYCKELYPAFPQKQVITIVHSGNHNKTIMCTFLFQFRCKNGKSIPVQVKIEQASRSLVYKAWSNLPT
jgi:hypothetical protein